MFLLPGNIISREFKLRKPNRKRPVTILPREIVQIGVFGFDPERGSSFGFFNHLGEGVGAGQRAEEVNMVFDAADDEGLAIEVGQDAAEVAVEFRAEE